MKEATIIFTVEFTDVVKDINDLALLERTSAEDARKLQEQAMNAVSNFDKLEVKSLKVFLNEGGVINEDSAD